MHQGEKFNAFSHLIAAVFALFGLIYLVVIALATSDPWKIMSVSIYGISLVLLFASSTLCHWHSGRYENFLKKWITWQSIYSLREPIHPICW